MSRKSTPSKQNEPRTPATGGHGNGVSSTPNRKPLPVFNSYMSLFQVQEKLKKGEVIEGVLRINPKSYEDAYISAPGGGMDIYIGGVHDRNTALHGDVVAALLNPHHEWKVLHSHLDEYLETDDNLKSLVYMPLEPDISYSTDALFDSFNPLTHNTNLLSHITCELKDNIIDDDCDVVVEEMEEERQEDNKKKNKKHKRGRKKKKRNVIEAIKDSVQTCKEEVSPASTENNESLIKVEAPSSSSDKVIIVPPDQLSECELSDDDDSVKSLTLEYEDKLAISALTFTSDSSSCKNEAQNINLSCSKLDTEKKRNGNRKGKKNKEKLLPKKEESYESESKVVKGTSFSQKEIKETNPNEVSKWSTNSHIEASVEQVMRIPNWQKFIQRTATVVYIFERNHSRLAAGFLKPFADKNRHLALFSPTDNRIPRIKIPMDKCPPNFASRPQDFSKFLLLAKIIEWNHPSYAFGEICRNIGKMGDIEVETEALLLENGVDTSEFPENTLEGLPQMPWSIPKEEIERRTDLRESTIFTIDPSSARDLDDAMSFLVLPNGNFRVGVHIADVSYFVEANSELDKVAAGRSTTVYLIQKVIPMLPRPLCENLCSLNPGEDRLAFSVVWELTPTGELEGEWFGRTVIRSCIKLSYDHAQSMIENPSQTLKPEEFPELYDGHSLDEIRSAVNGLNRIAEHLRKKRLQSGALRLNQIKVGFTFDQESGSPNGVFIQENKDSNKLIEEFMLLANITTAQKIYNFFPELALLRGHPPPHDIQLDNTIKFLNQNGIYLNPTSSKTLSDSINKYAGNDSYSITRMQLIVNLCSKPMQFARYFCSGLTKDSDFHHYALNVPLYTHFTSPIRRYSDLIVHRLLASAIDPENYPLTAYEKRDIGKIAIHCNSKKQSAKIVQEVSCELHLAQFIRNMGEMTTEGMIIGILDRAVDVLVLNLGVIKRCYMEKLPLNNFFLVQDDDHKKALILEWKDDPIENVFSFTCKLTFFESVTVVLKPFENDALKFNAFLIRPQQKSS